MKIIAVDFDGTLCRHEFPNIGPPNESVIEAVKEEQSQGSKIILWTVRNGKYLDDALKWCAERDLVFDAVNENIPELQDKLGLFSPKILANEYWDDKAVVCKGGQVIR